MLSTHISGMSLEDKVSLLGHGGHTILLCLNIEMEGSSLDPSSPASKNSIFTIKWYKIRIDGLRGGELLPHRKSLFGFLRSLLHLLLGFEKFIQRINKYNLIDTFKDQQYVILYEMVQELACLEACCFR